ncbi:hypothetical protein QJS10_CPA05g00837 [Acorus calamus]|uniref:B30.2/SPRY domain-containing protein n=1 Tax=Acorus calamus TaxID=4465 RepID=A0AAV9EQB7_ACOCL|nr:hypothetical protein QJS10_CPA05g00837 [Acorus calamus]
MESLRATYGADDESMDNDNNDSEEPQQWCDALNRTPSPLHTPEENEENPNPAVPVEEPKPETLIDADASQALTVPKSEEVEEEEEAEEAAEINNNNNNGETTTTTTTNDEDFEESTSPKKRKPLSACLDSSSPSVDPPSATKKPKKKSNNVWSKPTSRKGKKKSKSGTNNGNNGSSHHHQQATGGPAASEAAGWIASAPRIPDRLDDSPEQTICLSKVYKAEKVELSEDRLTAGSVKGYRMVRATRGVSEGAWYFEIKILRLGETGHTRLGWTTIKGDLQAPVGYDGNSFGYRDIDGSKVHKALREKYGEVGYGEGDVIGFYINLPEGNLFAPKPPRTVWIKGQRYLNSDEGKDNPPKVVPESEILFFKNGVCQGVAFSELFGGCYYPAASMYTLPNQPNCEVRFNFGPDFEFFPQDFITRPKPRPMIEVPYHGDNGGVNGATENGTPSEKKN